MAILLLNVVEAVITVQYSEENISWQNVTSVTESEKEAFEGRLQPSTLYYFRAKDDDSNWKYTTQRTKAGGEGIMASLAVIAFVSALTAFMFILPYKVNFTNHTVSNLIIKRACVIFGMFLLSLDMVIVVTIADNFGLGVSRELFRYLWLINYSIYILIIYVFWKTLMDVFKVMKELSRQKRMGDLAE